MKKFLILLPVLLGFFMPSILVSRFHEKETDILVSLQATEAVEEEETETVLLKVKDKERIFQIYLEDYLVGVLLGEIPVGFESEAVKAQAVAARTYTLRKVYKQNKHVDADVCTDASCCQAYVSEESFLQSGGSADDLVKLKYIIGETAGEVLTYQGNLIEATYFSCSGGKTEDAVSVWGSSVPYLKSVESPGEENAKHYEEHFTFSTDEFSRHLGVSKDAVENNDLTISYTEGDGVDRLKIGDISFTGTQIRTLLALPSTSFTISVADETVKITTKGYGHRVGMSQYGADAMALEGKSYKEILSHYYPGTQLEKFVPS